MAKPLPATPKPSSLVATKMFPEFVLELQKTVFFLSGQALTPAPLLVAGPLKKDRYFFAAYLRRHVRNIMNMLLKIVPYVHV